MTSCAFRLFLVHVRSVRRQPVCVRQQDEIDAARFETERPGVLLTELATSLTEAAVNQNALPAHSARQRSGGVRGRVGGGRRLLCHDETDRHCEQDSVGS